MKLAPAAGEREVLHPLFIYLADRRVLLYGVRGFTDVDDLYEKIDAIRGELTMSLQKLRPNASIVPWIKKLSAACQELLKAANEAARSQEQPDFEPAVNQLREAFRHVADHVAAIYKLPSARDLADRIRAED